MLSIQNRFTLLTLQLMNKYKDTVLPVQNQLNAYWLLNHIHKYFTHIQTWRHHSGAVCVIAMLQLHGALFDPGLCYMVVHMVSLGFSGFLLPPSNMLKSKMVTLNCP